MRDFVIVIPIISALIIYWARIAELKKRRDVVSEEIRENLTLRLFVAVGSVMLIGSIAEQLWTRAPFNPALFVA